MGFVKKGAKKSKLSLGKKGRAHTPALKHIRQKVSMARPRKRKAAKIADCTLSTTPFALEDEGGDFCPFSLQGAVYGNPMLAGSADSYANITCPAMQ